MNGINIIKVVSVEKSYLADTNSFVTILFTTNFVTKGTYICSSSYLTNILNVKDFILVNKYL